MKPRTHNPAHHEQLQKQAQERAADLDALHATFDPPHGQHTLNLLLRAAGLPAPALGDRPATRGTPCFIATAPGTPCDPAAAAVRDGRKSLLWDLLGWLQEDRSGTGLQGTQAPSPAPSPAPPAG